MYGTDPTVTAPRQPTTGLTRRSLLSTLVAVPALAALVACTSAPATQPNVSVASTQVAAGATLVASPAATALAAASPALAAIMGSPGASPSPSPSPSPAALMDSDALRIADASLADATPWVSLQNSGDELISVSGWQLQVGSATAELPENANVQPGGTLTLHAGTGRSSDDELFLGNAGEALAAAAQPGTPVRLKDETGRVVSEVTVPRF